MDNTSNLPLHERRYNEMKHRNAEKLKRALESAVAEARCSYESENPAANQFDSKLGKDIYFKPLIYYSLVDCIVNAKKLHKAQAASNIEKVREARAKHGQVVTTASEKSKVQGQIANKSKAFVPMKQDAVKMHRIVDDWCNAVCVFNCIESSYGTGKMKRRGYELISVEVVYWLKKGGSVGKETILKRRFFYNSSPAPEGMQKV